MQSENWILIEILFSYDPSTTLLVLSLYFCIDSPYVRIPQESKIADFLDSGDDEEVNSEEYIKI